MFVFINGKFVPEDQAVVSVFDRSFLYGDGLFETMRVLNGRPFRWDQHIERLQRGAEFIGIRLPFDASDIEAFVTDLIARNHHQDCLLRLTLSRGVGVRGYSPKGADQPALVITTHSAPEVQLAARPWRLVTSSRRLPANEPLSQFKTCNKLAQILARAEADAVGADEALLLNSDGFVVEASSSNLFWISRGTVCTPPLASGILSGVTRLVVMEICKSVGLQSRETATTPENLHNAEGVFVSLSSVGIAEAASLDSEPLRQSPVVAQIRDNYSRLLVCETSAVREPA